MNLKDYLATSPDAFDVLQARLNLGHRAQIRQWRDNFKGRKPSPESAVAIELATEGRVRRWDTRPDDWYRIWPELIGTEGAPAAQPKAA